MRRLLVVAVGSICLVSNLAYAQGGETASPPPPPPLIEPAPAPAEPVEALRPEVSSAPKNAITTGPGSLITAVIGIGSFNLEFERALMPSMSFFVAPDVQFGSQGFTAGTGGPSPSTYRTTVFGVGAHAGVRFYPLNSAPVWAPKGFWAGPSMHAAWATATATGTGLTVGSATASGVEFSAGAQIGYTFLFGNAFALSLGGGGGINLTSVSAVAPGVALSQSNIGFAAMYLMRLNLGYAF